ncbi:MAG: SRPBCC family protein [Nitriliruptoraceae bacterium]
MRIAASREVAAPAERVWEVVTDIEGSATVLSAVDAVERLDDGVGFEVGTRWRETRTMLGRQATEEMEVTAVDAPRSYTVVAGDAATTYTSTITVEPRGAEGCLLSMTFAGSSSGLVARVLAATVGRAFAGATRRALEQDLDDLAARAEAGSAA